MYLEERVKNLEEQLKLLSYSLTDLRQYLQSEKPVLRVYSVEVPVPFEDYTDPETRISVNGTCLTVYAGREGERPALEGYLLVSWVEAVVMCAEELGLDYIVELVKTIPKDPEERTSVHAKTLSEIKSYIKSHYTFVYDNKFEVDIKSLEFHYL